MRVLTAGGVLPPWRLPLILLVVGVALAWSYGPMPGLLAALLVTVVLLLTVHRLVCLAWFRGLGLRDRQRLLTICLTVHPAVLAGAALAMNGTGPLATPLVMALIGAGATGVHLITGRPVPVVRGRAYPGRPPDRTPATPVGSLDRARRLLATAGPGAALPALRHAIADPAVDAALALTVADQLVQAQSARAEQSGDDTGYHEAIGVLDDLVQRHQRLPGGRSRLHSHRAQYLMYQAARLVGRGGPATPRTARRLHQLYTATEAELRAAVRAAPAGSRVWARECSALGMLLCQGAHQGEPDRSDEGITLIRRAVDVLPPGPSQQRTLLELATALALRVQLRDDPDDSREIRRIVARVAGPGSPLEAQAAALLADLGR
ncbi:hypothetical protein [Actinoplanes rectilineatus]|uniref:hypothetical protein n=1 Tax=Actinoplanes rectilineatus TaxID=113571 RepID=UPI000A9BE38D|nr:hypothetical protein [Actinoplanes rectilineatus]